MHIKPWLASAVAMLAVAALPNGATAATPEVRLTQGLRPAGAGDLGISPNPIDNTPGQENINPIPLPQSEPPRVGLFPSLGVYLLDHGIEVHGNANDRFFANPSAGSRTGYGYNNAGVRPFIDIDLQKLIGLPGGSIHAAVTFFALKSNVGHYLFQQGGELGAAPAGKVEESNTLSILTYEQKALNDTLSVEVGRTNLHQYFLIPNSINPFTWDSTLILVDGDVNSITYSQWGGRVNYHLTPAWYVQAGAFQDDYRRAVRRDYSTGIGLSSGANILAELAYRTEFSTAQYPGNMEVGFEWNTRRGLSNIKGTGATALPGRTAADYSGGGVFFAQGAQVVWRGPAEVGSPPKNISIYGQFDASVDKPQPFDLDLMAGVNFTGFIPGRPSDVTAFQSRYQRLSAVEANFESRLQMLRGHTPNGTQSRDGVQLEIDHRIILTPWFAFTGFAQYLIHPDDYNSPTQHRGQDGVTVGAFATVSFGPLLGTSKKPF